jgi:hypothetical protein
LLLPVALHLAAPASVRAQSPKGKKPDAAASDKNDPVRKLKQQGEEAMLSLRYRDALTSYEEAYKITQEPGLLYNMARAYQGLEQYPEALRFLERFRTEAPDTLRERVPQLDEMIKETQQRVATLTLVVEPSGARVRLRGVDVGKAPVAAPLRVRSGAAVLEVDLDGFLPHREELTLEGARSRELRVQLLSRDPAATLALRTNPEGVAVTIDGKPFGASPIEAHLEPGSHRIQLRQKSYRPLDTEISLDPRTRRELTLSLEPTPPLTSRWWFWTGVGVVLVGGVALTYALTTEKAPPSGTIDPGRIQNALVRF